MKTNGIIEQDDTICVQRVISTLLFPAIATVLTMAIYISLPLFEIRGLIAVVGGAIVTAFICIKVSCMCRLFTSINRANVRTYEELAQRVEQLHVRLQAFQDEGQKIPAYYEEGEKNIKKVEDELLGESKQISRMRWLLANGYNVLWQRIHRIEEVLLMLEPEERVVSEAVMDERRIDNSQISNRDQLLVKLRAARNVLAHSTYLRRPPEICCRDYTGQEILQRVIIEINYPNKIEPEKDQATQDSNQYQEARETLRIIRRTLNEFRVERYNGLVEARNRLIKTGWFTSLFGYMMISLVILVNINQIYLIGAAVFFLVGAIIGLFYRLHAESNYKMNVNDTEIQDYGLTSARLIYTPLFAGLAAITGVVFITILRSPFFEQESSLTLTNIFDFNHSSYLPHLVIAAIFGLTPNLLINHLKSETDTYKAELRATEPAGITLVHQSD